MDDSAAEAFGKGLRDLNDEVAALNEQCDELEAERNRLLALIDTMARGDWLTYVGTTESQVLAQAARTGCSDEPHIYEDHLGDLERYYPACSCGWQPSPPWVQSREEAQQVFKQHNTLWDGWLDGWLDGEETEDG